MDKIIQRVCSWNAARYEQEYNKDLALSLLAEEYKEWTDAENNVDKLDAMCDLIYVAIGVLWKIGKEEADWQYAAESVDSIVDVPDLAPAYFIAPLLTVYELDETFSVIQVMQRIVFVAIAQMLYMGLSYDQAIEALNIVCDANDSKSIKKTASDVKANTDKGPYFRSPEPRLTKLLEDAGCLWTTH